MTELLAIYRNCTDAVYVEVDEVFSNNVFRKGRSVYDIRDRITRNGKHYRFDKFRPKQKRY